MKCNSAINGFAFPVAFFVLSCNANAGSIRVIADTNTRIPAPGATASFANFGQLNGGDPSISGENVAFGACCVAGYFARIDGELGVIANLLTDFPDSDVQFRFATAGGSSPSICGENVAFGAFMGFPGPGVICTYIDGSFRVVATAGVTPLPDGSTTLRSFFLRNGASPSLSGENIAFMASTEDGRSGIYAYINGSLRVIADTTTLVPGAPTPRTFQNFGQLEGVSPSISGENVAFFGRWNSGGPSPGAGVYAYINGKLRVIADTTTPMLPDAAPFCGSFFGGFGYNGGGPSISGENVAFLGCGIFAYINGKLRVIADSDTPAPGSTGTFGAFPVSPSISGQNVAFGAGADGIGMAIFAYIDGSLRLIADSNTPVPGHDTTFNGFFLMDPSDFSSEGSRPAISGENVVFLADAFVPGEHHVTGVYAFLAVDVPGDFDGNGRIELRDAAAFQRCMGLANAELDQRDNCLCLFDADENGAIDLTDFAAFQAAILGP